MPLADIKVKNAKPSEKVVKFILFQTLIPVQAAKCAC